ncbi:hypothetical protein EJ02DRAFT_500194 [Clathrospora elynae]|uniref:Uncharacterized protein n=1 Tax=Clathrospora elynae TaxID=706981 RepID=A0A6A5T5L6_9PLEO|nr:hypothetical protein EJ02DRAFT_500194 [Clathrospora elynae]
MPVCSSPHDAAHSLDAERAHGHQQGPTIDEVIHRFLENLKLRFGEDSFEVNTVFHTLHTFRSAEISKKDAYAAIRRTLEGEENLKQDLMSVLFHGDAKWGMGDFDLDPPVLASSPQFLHPAHQPQMRLPPLASSWCVSHQAYQSYQSIDPAVLSNYGGPYPASSLMPPMPPMPPMPNHFQFPSAFISPIVADSARFSPHMGTGLDYEAERSPARQYIEIVPRPSHVQQQWGRANYGKARSVQTIVSDQSGSALESNPLPERAHSFASNHVHSPAPSHDAYNAHSASPKKEVLSTATPSILGTPVAVPIGRPTSDMPPPPRKRSRRASVVPKKEEVATQEDEDEAPSHTSPPATATVTTRPLVPRQLKNKTKTEEPRTRSEGGGAYIHSICGRGFASKSKAKKHHWGNKLDDPETSTGCWAKHQKPNVSWNEHPSCKEKTSAPRAVKQAPQPMTIQEQEEFEQKSPMAPPMSPVRNTIPGVPTLHDLPQTVADTLNQRNATPNSFQNIGSYRSHQSPTRGSFDSLLTAVNVASQIDAPKPQGRHDSLVSHLDAQAVAAERNRQYVSTWFDASSHAHEQEASAYGRHHPHTANGLGISYPYNATQLPWGSTVSLQRDHYVYSPCSGSPTDVNWCNDRLFHPSNRGPAFNERNVSPDTKRRKV